MKQLTRGGGPCGGRGAMRRCVFVCVVLRAPYTVLLSTVGGGDKNVVDSGGAPSRGEDLVSI